THRQYAITNPNCGMSRNDTIDVVRPMNAKTRPAVPHISAERDTFRKECGSGGVGGSITYCLRAIQRMKVETNMSAPGIPKAIAGPRLRKKIGIRNDAKSDPKLMIQ